MWESGDKIRGDRRGDDIWSVKGEATSPKNRYVTPSQIGNDQQEDVDKICDSTAALEQQQ